MRNTLLFGLLVLLLGLAGCIGNPQVAEMLQLMAASGKGLETKASAKKFMQGVDDTARIIFVSMIDNGAQICSIRPNGKDLKQLTRNPGYKCRPMWSLDHKQITYFHYVEEHPISDVVDVVVINADGSNARNVVVQKKIDTQRTRISWKADASVIYIQEKDFPSVLFGYTVASGAEAESIRIPKKSFIKEAQTLSPDGMLIAGVGPDPKSTIMHMGSVKLDGKGDVDYMKFFDKQPYHLGTVVWSYDSKWVAFELDVILVVMSSTYSLSLKVYPIAPIEPDVQYTAPAFSPSGKYIACIKEKSREGQMGSGDKEVRSDIFVMDINGAHPIQITNTGACFDTSW